MAEAIWYFDFISPFAYLQFSRLSQLPADLRVTMKPVLFAALLDHHGQKGPAEIPSKRQFVYRFFKWQAARRGMVFNMPPMHPFQPLPPLRLAIAAGGTSEVVGRIFDFIYGRGRNVEGAALLELGRELGLDDLETRITDPQVKERLRENTNEAISAGVFGVPSFVARGELFWGDDATDMLLDFIKNPALFDDPEMVRLSNMPMGVRRGVE